MATPSAILGILVKASTSEANLALAKTDAQLNATTAAAERTTVATSKIGPTMAKMGKAAALAGGALAVGFVVEAKKAIDTTQELTKSTIGLHKNFGLSTKSASEWAGVARARGVDSTKLGMAFKTLATQITAARDGSASAQLEFKRLGFSQADMNKAAKDSDFLLAKVSDGLNNLKGGADKTAISGRLFGRGWATVAPILRDGSAAMQDQLDTVAKYGGVISGPTLKAQKDLLATQRESKIAWQGIQIQLANFVTPALQAANEQFQKIARIMGNKKLTDDQKFARVAQIIEDDFNKALQFVLDAIPEIASRVGQTAPKVAVAFVKGFLESDVWGKLAIGAFLITKLGGWKAIASSGAAVGTRWGAGFVGSAETEMAGLSFVGPESAAASSTPWGAILAGSALATFGVHELMNAFQKLIGHEDEQTRAAEILGGQYGNLGKLAEKYAAKVKTQGDLTNRAFENGAMVVHQTATAEGQMILQLIGHHRDLGKVAGQMSDDNKKAWISVAQQAFKNGDITRQQLQKVKANFGDAGDSIHKFATTATTSFKDTQKGIHSLADAVDLGTRHIGNSVNQALQALGAKKVAFGVTQGLASAPGQHSGPRRATGGLAGIVPGHGSGDTVAMRAMVTPGEGVFVMKKSAMADLQAFNDAPHLASGGLAGMQPGISKLIQNVISRFGGSMSSGYRPGDPGFHGRGLAADWVGGDWLGASKYINSIGPSLLEGIHQAPPGQQVSWDSGHQVSPSFWGASTWAAHTSHIHMAIAGAVKGMIEQIKRQMISGPDGALKSMGQGALDKVRHAANAYLSKKTPTVGVESMAGLGVPTGPIQQMAHAMINQIWGAGQWGPFNALEMQEAGWNPKALNPSSGAAGLAQALPASKYPPGAWPYTGLNSAKLQLQWMMGYIRDRYGTPAGAWGHEQAVGWYGGGGRVPGPIGRAQPAVVHGGENIYGPGGPHVAVYVNGDIGAVMDEVLVEVDGVMADNYDVYMRDGGKTLARRRQLAGHAGRE